MKTYKVIWEVSKYAYVKANSEAEAREKILNNDDGDVVQYENEITADPYAIEFEPVGK